MRLRGRLLLIAVALLLAITSVSCGDMYQSIVQALGEKNCTSSAAQPAGADRRLVLFAKNHIYVASDSPGQYDPNATTKHPYSGVPTKNSDLVNSRSKWFGDLYAQLNTILEDAGANVYVYSSGYEIEPVDQSYIQADLSLIGTQGKTLELATGLYQQEPEWIHVLWLWTSDSATAHVGEAGMRIVALSKVPGSLTFAHEFAHVLGIDTHVYGDPTNLMNDGSSSGPNLNATQLKTIWNSLNNETELTMMSCDK